MARKFIYCLVNPTDNSYDYETDGCWTDDLGALRLWQLLGVQQVVALDVLSMELVLVFNNEELDEYLNNLESDGENINLW